MNLNLIIITETVWYENSKAVHLFIHLLSRVVHDKSVVNSVQLEKGQVLINRRQLSFETGMSEQNIRTCLKVLMEEEISIKQTNKSTQQSTQHSPQQSTQLLSNKSNNKNTILTICNYDSYFKDKNAKKNQKRATSNPTINPTFNEIANPTINPTLDSKNDNAEFKQMLHFWLKEFHPDWTFKNKGSALKSIIEKIRQNIKSAGKEVTTELVVQTFKTICLKLPDFFKNKDLDMIDRRFNEIISDIKSNKQTNGKQEQRISIIANYGKNREA